MSQSYRRPGWTRGALQLVIGKADKTAANYVFEDGTETEKPAETDLEILAEYCERAFKIVEINKQALQDARNLIVDCEAEVAKSELHLEHHQGKYIEAAGKRSGVPCPTL